jgi:hypothetical protein
MTEHPYITFRDGPTGPRAALIDGPDVWEVIQTIDSHPGDREAAIPATAELLSLTEQQVQTAIDYRATNHEEIDARIKLNAQTRKSWGDLTTSSRPPRQRPFGDSMPSTRDGSRSRAT